MPEHILQYTKVIEKYLYRVLLKIINYNFKSYIQF